MNAAPRRILHVLRSPRAEGTVRLAIDLMRTTTAEHEALVLEEAPADLAETLKESAQWIRIERALPKGVLKFPWITAKVWAACRRCRPDTVICWPNGFGAFVLLGAALAGVRGLVTHAGNPPTPTRTGRAHTVMTTAVVWLLGGRMICCSRYVADRFAGACGRFASILRVVPNCAPLALIRAGAESARSKRPDRRPRLVMVATLETHKDHATLLRAMPTVLRASPDSELWIVGDGSLRAQLAHLARELGVERAVRFLGSRSDVPSLLGQCDVFVFSTTDQEGMGTVLVEAMAAGLPVVASDVPACREVLADGKWGRLPAAGDSAALARELIDSLRHPANADSQARRDALQQYQPDRMMADYLEAVAS